MTVLKPRSRMISVRLSEDEYSALQHFCEVTGARSVSDLTRDAVRALMGSPTQSGLSIIEIEEFRAQMDKLNRKVEELCAQSEPPNNTAA
jgi:hypothetical protein